MLKRALMLTAATAALVSVPVYADVLDITTKVTDQIKTSTALNGGPADILIESTGSVVVSVAGPAIEVDTPNIVTNQGTISNTGITGAIGVQLDATAAGNGPGTGVTALDSTGTIDLTGVGDTKTGILVGIANGDDTGIFTGDINLEAGSKLNLTGDTSDAIHISDNTTLNGNITLGGAIGMNTDASTTNKTGILIGTSSTALATVNGDLTLSAGSTVNISGDSSIGIHVEPGSVLNGNMELDGSITMAPTDAQSTTNGNVIGIDVERNPAGNAITGNVTIADTASISASGYNAQGVVLAGSVGGYFENSGTITIGTSVPGTSNNPIGGVATAVGASVAGGMLNNGPTDSTDSTAPATIFGNGFLPTLLIAPIGDNAGEIHIGTLASGGLMDDPNAMSCALVGEAGECSLVNRGTITATAANANQVDSKAVLIEGTGTFDGILDGGFFNSGTIRATVGGDTKQSAGLAAYGLEIGSGGVVPILFNSTQDNSGTITAIYGGSTYGGQAFAIDIEQGGTLSTIVNQGTIRSVASISGTAATDLESYAILDKSGTLNRIDNYGTISAVATKLDDDSQKTIAIDLGAATAGTTINNYGTIIGDVITGNGADHILVSGTTNALASITGDIEFGGSQGADDSLEIDDYSTVKGTVTDRAGGSLDVLVLGGGTLMLTNDSIDPSGRFTANTFTINNGATLGLTLSQTYNLGQNPDAGGIVTTTGQAALAQGALLQLGFGSFLSSPDLGASQFTLIDAPLGDLSIGDFIGLQTQICSQIPFLFQNSTNCLQEVDANNRSQLQLVLDPKSAQDLNLHGYALTMFPFVNAALVNDDQLGAAVISAGLPVNGVPLDTATGDALYQKIYSEFAPDATGASRALAIAITDQGSGPVGARQRELRMYAAQPGDTTLWTQQFAVNLNQDANVGTIGYRDSGYGLAVGMDGGDPADGRYGAALTFYSGDITEKDPLTSKTNTLWAVLTGYTDWRGKGFFLDTQLSTGVGNLDGHRSIDVGGVTRVAQGKRPALLGTIGATTGVILTSGSTIFTPLLSVDGMAMREDAYSEKGGGDPNSGDGFDLRIQPTYYDSLRGFAGVDVRQDINLGDFFLQPEARVGYRYDFVSNPEKVKGAFESTGTPFSITGPDPARGDAVFGGSLSATTGAWSIGLHYDYLRGDNGSISQVGTLTLLGRI